MNIWYDVSGLYNWSGNFTGIQRAVFNIGKSLSIEDPSARFFIFQHGNFKEITFADLENRLVELRKSSNITGNKTEEVTIAKLRHHGMVKAKQLVIGSSIEVPLRKTYGALRATKRNLRASSVKQVDNTLFKTNDIVVIVDGNWQFRDYDKLLIMAKKKAGFKLVHFVHDLASIRNPAIASKGAKKIIGTYFENIFPFTDKLLAISESTKRDISWFCTNLNIKTPDISVVILGSDIQQNAILEPVQPRNVPAEAFMLAVSTVEVRKNYLMLYYAYKQAARQNIALPPLVIVGRKGWMAEETYSLLTNDPDVQKSIQILSGVRDEELEWLYQNCIFTIFPSMYEGWGLPVAESLSHGKVCISSDVSSMPEVGGDLVSYISPYNPAEAIEKIKNLCNDKTRRELEERIRAHYKPVTWQDTYESFRKEVKILS